MATERFFLDNLWRDLAGLPEFEDKRNFLPDLEVLRQTEWSPAFEKGMRDKLIMGCIRYGAMGHGSKPEGKPLYDRCESIRKRLKFFEETGDGDWLIDIGNMALLMFEERQHPNFHIKGVDDGYHDNIIG